jgi:hypothetical protein
LGAECIDLLLTITVNCIPHFDQTNEVCLLDGHEYDEPFQFNFCIWGSETMWTTQREYISEFDEKESLRAK